MMSIRNIFSAFLVALLVDLMPICAVYGMDSASEQSEVEPESESGEHLITLQDAEDAEPIVDISQYIAQGPAPAAWAKKLEYYARVNSAPVNAEKIKKMLDTAEYYFLSISFHQADGYTFFQELALQFGGEHRSFNYKKIPLMMAVALTFDKFLYIPIIFATAIGSYFALFGVLQEDFTSHSNFSDPNIVRNNCHQCAENWVTFEHNQDAQHRVIIGNHTLYPISFNNLPSCASVVAHVQSYVDLSLFNKTISNLTRWQYFTAVKQDGQNNINLYRTLFMWGYPHMIETYTCNPAPNPIVFLREHIVPVVSTCTAGMAVWVGRYIWGENLK